MPREWNTRSILEVPELFVCGLLHASERPTWLGSASFNRATLSNSSWLSSGERPRLPLPRKGLTWAWAAADKRRPAASAHDKQRDDQSRIQISSQSPSASPLRLRGTPTYRRGLAVALSPVPHAPSGRIAPGQRYWSVGQFAQIVYHQMRAMTPKLFGVPLACDADNEAKATGRPCLHSRDGILDDNRPFWLSAE